MILISGEALIDLIPDPETDGRYDAVLGGSPFNVAIGLARLGGRASFISRLSADANGESLAAALVAAGVDLSLAARDPRPTMLAFVMRGTAQTGSRYSFYLDATAFDGPWPFPELWPAGARHLHVGSVAALDPRHGERVVEALARRARPRLDQLRSQRAAACHPRSRGGRRASRAAGAAGELRQGQRGGP